MLIKDLPEDIKRIAIQRTIEYRNENINIHEFTVGGGFDWSKTIEYQANINIWSDVDNGKYESFYEFHKTDNKNNLLNFNQY